MNAVFFLPNFSEPLLLVLLVPAFVLSIVALIFPVFTAFALIFLSIAFFCSFANFRLDFRVVQGFSKGILERMVFLNQFFVVLNPLVHLLLVLLFRHAVGFFGEVALFFEGTEVAARSTFIRLQRHSFF